MSMAWSKYDPTSPPADAMAATDAQAARRAQLLKWGTIISWIFTAIGFGFMAYWYYRQRFH